MVKTVRLFSSLLPILVLAMISAPGSHAEEASKNVFQESCFAPDLPTQDDSPLPSAGPQNRSRKPTGTLTLSSSSGRVSGCSQSSSDYDIFCNGMENPPNAWCCGSLEPCLEFCMAVCDSDYCIFVE